MQCSRCHSTQTFKNGRRQDRLLLQVQIMRRAFRPGTLRDALAFANVSLSNLTNLGATQTMSSNFGFWILDFGLTPTTKVQGKPNFKLRILDLFHTRTLTEKQATHSGTFALASRREVRGIGVVGR